MLDCAGPLPLRLVYLYMLRADHQQVARQVPAQAAERAPELTRLPGLRIAQGDLVGLGDAVCLDGS
jgi:hypothetical protein